MNSWPPKAVEKFWSQVEKTEGCWPWSGYKDRYGYGRFRYRYGLNVDLKAHRISFWLAHGYWPELVRHTCDNPPCCNPSHLLSGDHRSNARDAVERGRHVPHPRKFDPELEDEIRREYTDGGTSYRKLARKYGTSYGHIQWIMKRGKVD